MSNIEVTRDAPRMPSAPVDPNVQLPKHVRDQIAQAEAHYERPSEPDPKPTLQVSATVAPTAPPPPPAPVTPTPAPAQPAAQVQADPPAPPPIGQGVDDPATPEDQIPADQLLHRNKSWRGRWDKQREEIAQLQEIVQQQGDELGRVHQLLARQPVQEPTLPTPTPPTRLITEQDEQNYGTELIDLVRRAAKEGAQEIVQPVIEEVRQDVSRTKAQLAQDARARIAQALDQHVPEWRGINESARFKQWLRLRDIYSGAVRHQLLSAAFQAADAARVVAFFQGFVQDEQATGNAPTSGSEPPPAPAAPRTPQVSLQAIATPGHERPATGTDIVPTATPVNQQTITRADISRFYAEVRRGLWAGRDAEKDRVEQMIFAAQNSGRVKG